MSKLPNAATLAVCLVVSACNQNQVTLARPAPAAKASKVAQALGGSYTGTATFDVPVVNPNTWQGSPMGTGSWSAASSPAQSGGPQGIGFYDGSTQPTMHYVMIGNFGSPAGTFFGILSDGQPLTVGTTQINNTSLYAGIFDMATGDPVALASSGTLTLTAAGLIGGKITGTFSGTLDEVVNTGCTSSAQCAAGEQCINGTCIRTGCTSNAQCPTGTTCQAGQCVAPPQCTSNAQCGAGQICQSGVCVAAPGCTSNAQCGAGKVCQAGQCVNAPPGCTSNAQCASGQVCQAGQCVTVVPGNCSGQQGSGSYSGKAGTGAVCSALGNGSTLTNAVAAIDDDGAGGLALFVVDPARESAGVVIPLNACPSGLGPVPVSGAVYWDEAKVNGVTYYAAAPALSATVVFTKVGARTVGDFHLTLAGGGTVSGDFDVQ